MHTMPSSKRSKMEPTPNSPMSIGQMKQRSTFKIYVPLTLPLVGKVNQRAKGEPVKMVSRSRKAGSPLRIERRD